MSDNDVDIWKISFSDISISNSDLDILCFDEISKANRFHNVSDQDRYRYMHISLRKIISTYNSDILPSKWVFKTNRYGKPFIVNKLNHPLNFSISYTRNLGYILITKGTECGVDVEMIKEIELSSELKDMVLSYDEKVSLANSCDPLKLFYMFWTLKEAHVKALGVGLNMFISELCFAAYFDLMQDKNFFTIDHNQYSCFYYKNDRYILSISLFESTNSYWINFKEYP